MAINTFLTSSNDLYFTGVNDTISGGNGNDTIVGTSGAEMIYGNIDSDLLSGAAGDDQLYGGMGTDRLYGGNGNDYLFANNENDTVYGGQGDDFIHGGMESDILLGEGGNDTLNGGIDNDTISGGGGADVLIGGTGADRFTFSGAEGRDTISDFNGSESDKIAISGLAGVTQSNILSLLQNNGTGTVTLNLPAGVDSLGAAVVNQISIVNNSGRALVSADFIVTSTSTTTTTTTTTTRGSVHGGVALSEGEDVPAHQGDVLADDPREGLVHLAGVSDPDRDAMLP